MSRSRAEEAELVRQCAEGDAAAWEGFVDRYLPLIRVLARRGLTYKTGRGSDGDVDDVISGVFLALLRHERRLLKRYNPEYAVSTYLGVITRTEVSRLLRKSWRHPKALGEAERLEDPDVGVGPLHSLQERERQEAVGLVREAMTQLPDRDQLLLYSRYFEGLDYTAIAALVSVSPESVGQLLYRARARLKKRLPQDLWQFLEAPEDKA